MNPGDSRARAGDAAELLDWLLDDAHADNAVAIAPSVTYRGLRAAVNELAASLQARYGTHGGAVLVDTDRTTDSVVALLGVLAAGLTAVLQPPGADAQTIDHIIREVQPVARFGPTAGFMDSNCQPGPSQLSDSAAIVIYTSGTTAQPKGVQLSHRNLIANATGASEFIGLRANDTVSLVLPVQFSYGLSMLLVSLRARARLVLHPSFDFPAQCVALMRDQETTVFAGVPFHYQQLLRESSRLRQTNVPLRLILSAGGAMPSNLTADIRNVLPRATPIVMYGQTEATARLSYLPPEQLDSRPSSVGRGMPGIKLVVRDASGQPVAPGTVGEVYATGDSVMLGYLGDEAATAEVLTAWGLRTRDLATVDAEGFIYLKGRTADYAKIRGVRVSLPEVEAAAEAFDEVIEALAWVEFILCGEQIVLELCLADEVSDREWPRLQHRIKNTLSPAKRPGRIERVAAVRRTTNGKKLRRPPARDSLSICR
jgi:acyl-coenzyme A synthetase/AMP-(fatty) acid ligase